MNKILPVPILPMPESEPEVSWEYSHVSAALYRVILVEFALMLNNLRKASLFIIYILRVKTGKGVTRVILFTLLKELRGNFLI